MIELSQSLAAISRWDTDSLCGEIYAQTTSRFRSPVYYANYDMETDEYKLSLWNAFCG